jgi:hypothetical protein
MNNPEITQINNTLNISIDLYHFDKEVLDEVNNYLMNEYNRRQFIPLASKEEQAEIEAILNSMTDEDKEIVYSEIISVEI